MKAVSSNFEFLLDPIFSGIRAVCTLALLLLVLVQFSVVVGRYVFNVNFLWGQEFAIYLHSATILMGAGWSLLRDRHVRVDIFQTRMSLKVQKGRDVFGTIFFLFPMLTVIGAFSFEYAVSSWSILEGSAEVSGLPGVFLLKSLIPLFAVFMFMVGVCILVRVAKK